MKTILLTSSSGGHFEQLSILKKHLSSEYNVFILTEKTEYTNEENNTFYLNQINRKQINFIYKFLKNRKIIKKILEKLNPDVVISTGALATLSVCRIAHKMNKKVIFIESFAKINSPTKTGKVVYKFADEFIVQWPEMLKYYPKAKCFGGIY